jgi:signal transduction histidine kinase/DNA-binding response OmpR family regulator
MDEIIRINLLKGKSGQPSAGTTLIAEPGPGADPEAIRDDVTPMLVAEAGGRIVDASDVALGLLDYTREGLTTLYVSDVIGRLDESILDMMIKTAQSGRRVHLAALCYRHDGGSFPVEVMVHGVHRTKAGVWRIGLALQNLPSTHGVEGEVRGGADARLLRAERLDAVGSVAGKIAHDLNNLLTPLLAYPELIRREVPDNPTVGEYLTIIQKTTEDMTRVTQLLLSLARSGKQGTDILDINTLIRQVLQMMESTAPGGITTELDLPDNLLHVQGSRDQVWRVLENLIQNAREAMGDHGTLRIQAENVYLDAPVAQYNVVNIGEYVKISVQDTGHGIPEALKDKVFDPFFTTKRGSKQRGSGLGLTIVHAMVRDHRGYIEFESTEGAGTTFYVYLPIARQAVPPTAGDNLPHGTERILVVDDDALQVQVLVSLLEVLGYTVTGVSSGEECLRQIRDRGERYDLVLLDMIMEAGMGGLETFVAVRQVVPTQRVVLISGFTKAARSIVKAQERGAGAYLRKPLTIERVARTVREQLDMVPSAQTQAPRHGHRILIVDDEPMIRKLFGMIILSEFRDAVIDQAANGREAVDAFREGRHDLIIMDLQMPVMDGREAFLDISKLCQTGNRPVPPVIFCTGFAPPSSMNSIIGDESLHCLIRKPIKADTLLQIVRQRMRG